VTGGFRVQGRDLASARRIIADADAVAAAGAFCVVLELVPAELADIITRRLAIPTIGIGAGVDCDGQVLVAADVVGLDDRYAFKFVRRYAEAGQSIGDAFASFARDVRDGAFPGPEQSYTMKPEMLDALTRALEAGEDEG
jgi:3-methyl-2-oxobutanoate hydroxymethyltransferase